jgi:hypothetical protein
MKKKLLITSLTLPMLLFGAGQSLASTRIVHQDNLQWDRHTERDLRATLKTQQPPLFILAARDDRKKECEWLGICDGK